MIGSTLRHAASIVLVLLAFVLPLGAQDEDSQKSLAPQKLWAAQTSPNEVTLTWQPQTGIREFRILVAINQLAPVLLGSVGGNSSRYVARITDTGAQLMTFFIQAIAQDGSASEKAAFNAITPVKATVSTVIPGPASVAAISRDGSIQLNWSAVPGATGYIIGRAAGPSGSQILCSLCSTAPAFVDSSITTGVSYTYTVAAITPQGTSRRTTSNIVMPGGGIVGPGSPTSGGGVSNATGTGSTGTVGTVLKGVTNARATLTGNTVALTWTVVPGASQYIISRAGQVVATVAGSVSRWMESIQGLTGAIQYQIVAVNAKGRSSPVSFNTIDPAKALTTTIDLPKAPSNAKATLTGSTVELTWTVVPGASQYIISRAGQVVATVAGSVSRWMESIQGLTGAIQYQIVAVNAKGRSSPASFNTIDLSKGAR